MAIVYNLGTNQIAGEISFITQALAAVLQLAVTMDYSIFLWHSYEENQEKYPEDKNRAMAHAISQTVTSVVGSSITTIAGFLAMCFMTFTLGADLGVVMAKGVKLALGLDAVTGPLIPDEMVPGSVKEALNNGKYQMIYVMSEYKTGTDEVNAQCDEIREIIKRYDETAMLIGEAPCTQDLITITDRDFKIVNAASIVLIFLIIAAVLKSCSLPVILVAVIEFAIFINMGIPYYTKTVLPFIASIVIGTIQLGATVDYAILMTNKYKRERKKGAEKKEAVTEALNGSLQSVFVSALSFFAATFGVGIYSSIDMISSLCMLLSRGVIISLLVVAFALPAMFMFDGVIVKTSM